MTFAFAHRGGLDSGAAQNTLAAFADALARGCDLESDVRLAADGVPVLVHDAVWVRGPWPVVTAALPSGVLRRWGVCTLEELFAELGTDFELSLDLKSPRAISPLLAVLRKATMRGRTWVTHDDLGLLGRVRAADEVVRLAHEAPMGRIRQAGRTAPEHLALLAACRIDAQNTTWTGWSQELLARARGHGLRAFGSLAQTKAELADAASRGLDGIYSDHLTDMKAALGAALG